MATQTNLVHEEIFEPLTSYKNIYKHKHEENTLELFNELEKKAQVDVAANKKTIRNLKAKQEEEKRLEKKINRNNILRVFLIILTVISFVVMTIAIIISIGNGEFLKSAAGLLMLILGIVFGVGFLLLNVLVVRKKRLALIESKTTIEKEIKALRDEAWAQMRPLNELFEDGMSLNLFKKTIPIINLDPTFNSRRLDYLVSKFKFKQNTDVNRSTLYVQSGDINGNPFFIANDLVHTLGTKTYSGSLVIHWTETRTVNGRTTTVSKSETLTAYIERPCPYYQEEPYLLYANEAAPDLIFTRTDSDAEIMSDKQIDRHVQKQVRKLNKKAEKSLKKGENYTVMGNSEFEVLFGATNRNHEVQFCLLFTPLAQRQLLQLMKDKTIAFGDDFDFVKHKMINVVYPDHLATFDFDDRGSIFVGYDFELVKKNFIDYNNRYFKHIYFTFAPILAIPLYQQQKPHEYIYKDLYDSYVSFYEHEKVANALNASEFIHPLSGTRNILKTSLVKSGNFYDSVKVTSYGYQTIPRVEYVARRGGDGRTHRVPVEWVEYIPVSQEAYMNVNAVSEEKEETPAEKFKKSLERIAKGDFANEKEVRRVGLFLAYVVKKVSDK